MSERYQSLSVQPSVLKDISSTFFKALWRNDEAVHFLAIREKNATSFAHEAVTLAEVPARVAHHATRQADVYLACAGYTTRDNRTQTNATGAFVFWLDIDVGAKKVAQGQGYATLEEAQAALNQACAQIGLPAANHVISSGGGLHAYFVLEEWVTKEQWQTTARQLKAVLAKVGLRADPACTADIARVLRIPGTLNHKYDPPQPVETLSVTVQSIPNQIFTQAVQSAYQCLCPVPDMVSKSKVATALQTGGTTEETKPPLDLARLRSAMAVLPADCDDYTWKFLRIVPLVQLAKEYPEHAEEIKQTAMDWSSGVLAGVPSKAWTTPGNTNKLTGQQAFPSVWKRFIENDYTGNPVTVGTIYHDALEAGWKAPTYAQVAAVPAAQSQPQVVAHVPDQELPIQTEGEQQGQQSVTYAASHDELQVAILQMERVIKQAKDDVGAPFEPEALSAMAMIRGRSMPEYQRIKLKLKEINKKIAIATLESAVKSHRAQGAAPGTHHGYAEDMLRSLICQGYAPCSCDGSLFMLNGKTNIWVELAIAEVEKRVALRYDGQPHCTKRSDYSSIAQHSLTLVSNPDFFDQAPPGVATEEGFYRVVDGRNQLQPLKPEDRQRVMLSFSPKTGPMPLFDDFLNETFKSSQDGEKASQILRVQEVSGAIMLGLGKRFQKAILFYDPYGRAGKGTLVEILKNLVPDRYVTAVSPFAWGREYYVVSLAGARLNLVGELPDGESLPAAQFKTVLGGDLITGRHPTHRPISFKNEATHVFMSNHMINTRDQSEAFFARWEIIEFPNSRLLSGLPLDPDIAKRIVSKELPAIAAWAIEGAARLLKQGRYTTSPVHERLMKKWRSANNSVQEFMDESCKFDLHFYEKRSDFYKAYKEWCGENGRQPFSKGRVKELLTTNIGLGITLVEINGYESFKGLQLRHQG